MIDKIKITDEAVNKLLAIEEGHFSDIKSIRISPASLSKTISALSNAEGGELFIGIEDNPRAWTGFANIEDANGHLQAFEQLFPLGDGYEYQFLENPNQPGIVLKIDVAKG